MFALSDYKKEMSVRALFVRICNSHVTNKSICNAKIGLVLFVRICNSHTMNISICNARIG